MNGLEYMNKICPTTSCGKDPNREDVADAFEDGYAEGYTQVRKDISAWVKRKMSFEQGFEDGEAEYGYKSALEDLINYLNKMEEKQ